MANTLDPRDRDAVIRTMIGEAGDQGDAGLAGVANVIRNRQRAGFAPTPSGVVFQRGQFEPWTNPATTAKLRAIDPQSPAYTRAGQIADNVFSGGYADNTNGATHFFAPVLQADLGRNAPSWAATFKPTAAIGGHNFYQDPRFSEALGGAQDQGQPQMTYATDSTAAYGNGPVAPPTDMRDLAKILIQGAYAPTEHPGLGTTIGKLGQLLAGRMTEEAQNARQLAYLNSNPAISGGSSASLPSLPQATPSQQPTQGSTGPKLAQATPTPAVSNTGPVAVPESSGGQSAAPQRTLLVPPSADPAQMRARIEEQFPEKQIQWNLRNPDPAMRQQGMQMAQAKRTALAAIDQPDTETKTVTLPTGETAYATGNPYHGYFDNGQPHVDPAKIAGQKAGAEAAAKVGPEGETAYSKETGTYYGKKFNTIQTNAQSSMTELPQLQLLQRVMSDPAYTSGTGSNTLERLSSAARTMGLGSGQTATLMQFADKLGKTGALENIEELGTQGAVRVPTLNLIAKSNYSNDNTPEANRAVVEIRARAAQRTQDIADMATEYAATHGGRIDAGFDKQVRDHYKDTPLFTPDEIANYNGLFEGKGGTPSPTAVAAKPGNTPAQQFSQNDVEAEMRRRGLIK